MSNTINRAIDAIQSGDKATGRQLLETILHAEPRNEMALLWMAYVVDDPGQKRLYLRAALEVNPYNETAARVLRQLYQQTAAAAPPPESAPPAPAAPSAAAPPPVSSPPAPAAPPAPAEPTAAPPPASVEHLTREKQDPASVRKIHGRVTQILTRGEEILYVAIQSKPLVNITPDCVVLTNRRFIIYQPKVLGAASFQDYIWRDLRDAKLQENVVGATLTLQTIHGKKLAVDYLPKAQARRLYAYAQQMEEEVLEERRLRAMEEKRAASGGITFQTPMAAAAMQTPAPAAAGSAAQDPVQKLGQLKQMLDGGLITAAEYEAKKAEILSRM